MLGKGSMANSKSSDTSIIIFTTVTTTIVATTICISLCQSYYWKNQQKNIHEQYEKELKSYELKRQEERTGRIRAEVKLRTALLQLSRLESSNDNDNNTNNNGDSNIDNISVEITTNNKHDRNKNNNTKKIEYNDIHALKLRTIGLVISPYTKRMGTPRQGALVPTSRGYIQFNTSVVSPEAIDGIDEYSHVWIIFGFHINTSLTTSKKSKIRPPRGGGIKVGQLATRSPHRPNDIGLSLVQLDKWDVATKRLHIKALDLVDGTPVYDIKPYVHWDIPSGMTYQSNNVLEMPSWVERKDDVLPAVQWENSALVSLENAIKDNFLSPLYPGKETKKQKKKKNIKKDVATNDNVSSSSTSTLYEDSFAAAKTTLEEILAQDPRSSHKGLISNQRGSVSAGESYRLLFCHIQVEFVVEEKKAIIISIRPMVIDDDDDTNNNNNDDDNNIDNEGDDDKKDS